MSSLSEAIAHARTGAPRNYTVWVIRQPNGNYYLADKARQDDGVAVMVVRKGSTMIEAILPRAWRQTVQP